MHEEQFYPDTGFSGINRGHISSQLEILLTFKFSSAHNPLTRESILFIFQVGNGVRKLFRKIFEHYQGRGAMPIMS